MTHKPKTRLYIEAPLQAGAHVACEEAQAHYLLHTLRLKPEDAVALFNGEDGEWRAVAEHVAKKSITLRVEARIGPQKTVPDIWLLFAPVKNEKIDYTVKRAVELGVSALLPVMTRHTIVSRVNMERLRANAIEAAAQCGRTDVPHLQEPQALSALLGSWDAKRTLLFCDESGRGEALRAVLPALTRGAYGVLIGPEGGFAREEREMLARVPAMRAISLGPRILRAETAALASLSNIMAWAGDWDEPPHFEP